MVKALAISGSLRTGSFNRRLLAVAKKLAAETGMEVEEYDLRTNPLPVYDGDLESAGLPPEVQNLKNIIEKSDVIIIASPEYNYSIPGGLKNAIDWASRAGNSLKGKVGVIMGVSSGKYGTLRMQPDLRKVLGGLYVDIAPQPQIHLGPADEAFAESGALADQKIADNLKILLEDALRRAEAAK